MRSYITTLGSQNLELFHTHISATASAKNTHSMHNRRFRRESSDPFDDAFPLSGNSTGSSGGRGDGINTESDSEAEATDPRLALAERSRCRSRDDSTLSSHSEERIVQRRRTGPSSDSTTDLSASSESSGISSGSGSERSSSYDSSRESTTSVSYLCCYIPFQNLTPYFFNMRHRA